MNKIMAFLSIVCFTAMALLMIQLRAQEQAAQAGEEIQFQVFEGMLAAVDLEAKTLLVKSTETEMEFGYTDETEMIGAEEALAALAGEGQAPVRIYFKVAPEIGPAILIEILPPASFLNPHGLENS